MLALTKDSNLWSLHKLVVIQPLPVVFQAVRSQALVASLLKWDLTHCRTHQSTRPLKSGLVLTKPLNYLQLDGKYLVGSEPAAQVQLMASPGIVPFTNAAAPALGVNVKVPAPAGVPVVARMMPLSASMWMLAQFVVAAGGVYPADKSAAAFAAFSATVVLAADASEKHSVTFARTV